jgi:hypothetical protein
MDYIIMVGAFVLKFLVLYIRQIKLMFNQVYICVSRVFCTKFQEDRFFYENTVENWIFPDFTLPYTTKIWFDLLVLVVQIWFSFPMF